MCLAVPGKVTRIEELFAALALLVEVSPVGKTMGNLYMQIARPGVPTQMFTCEETAIRWLRRNGG